MTKHMKKKDKILSLFEERKVLSIFQIRIDCAQIFNWCVTHQTLKVKLHVMKEVERVKTGIYKLKG